MTTNLLELPDDILTKINTYVKEWETLEKYFKLYRQYLYETKEAEEEEEFLYELDLEDQVERYFGDFE